MIKRDKRLHRFTTGIVFNMLLACFCPAVSVADISVKPGDSVNVTVPDDLQCVFTDHGGDVDKEKCVADKNNATLHLVAFVTGVNTGIRDPRGTFSYNFEVPLDPDGIRPTATPQLTAALHWMGNVGKAGQAQSRVQIKVRVVDVNTGTPVMEQVILDESGNTIGSVADILDGPQRYDETRNATLQPEVVRGKSYRLEVEALCEAGVPGDGIHVGAAVCSFTNVDTPRFNSGGKIAVNSVTIDVPPDPLDLASLLKKHDSDIKAELQTLELKINALQHSIDAIAGALYDNKHDKHDDKHDRKDNSNKK